MADLDNVAPAGDDEDELLSDLRSALRGESEPGEESPAAAEVPAEPAETQASDAERARDEKGRFAPKQAKPDEPPAAETPVDPQAPAAPVEAPEQAPQDAPRPPPGWSPTAKAAFTNLPPEVQQAVAQRELEINKGFAKLAEYKSIEPYAQMARQNGTTLDYALQQYVGIENLLKQDFLAGIERLCQNSRVDPTSLAQAILARSGSGAPQPAPAGNQGQGHQTPGVPGLEPVMQELNQLKSYIATQQQQQTQAEIQRFASDPSNTFFENVRPQMAQLMQAGLASTLKEAYDAACWNNAEIRALLIKQQATGQARVAQQAAAATQARQAAKSITGSPTPGAKPAGAADSSIEDMIRAQFRAAQV